jgi:tetratricopeptide (TPR) repeat protein
MKKKSRVPNKKLEGTRPALENGNQSVRSRHISWVKGIACLALALGCVGFVHLATAHQGFDPEIAELTEDLTKDPDSVELLIRRGQVYRSYGKFTESLQDLEQAWLLDRENREVAFQRGLTLSAMGRNQEAEAALDNFLQEEVGQKQAIALAERAAIRARTGRPELAIEDYTAVLVIQQTGELYLLRGKLQVSLGRLEEATVGYQEGIAKLGDSVLLKKGLIEIRIAQGKFDQALVLIDEQMTRTQVKIPWLLQRAEVLGQMGQGEAARKTYEQALSEANRILAKRPTALHLLARAKVLNAMGQREKAVLDLQDALQKSPGFAPAKTLLQQLGGQ